MVGAVESIAANTTVINALSGLLGAIATVGLFILYRQQRNILNAQKEIQRIEQLPEIDIVNRTFDGDDLEVTVSNYGPGIAKNVRFCTAISAPLDESIESVLLDSRARRVRGGEDTTLEQMMNPHESEVQFRGTPRAGFRLDGDERPYGSFSTAFHNLQRENPETVSFQIYVVVDDQLGGCQSKPLFGARNPIRTGTDDTPDDAPDPPELSSYPSLEELWDHSGLKENVDFDFPEPDCRN